MDDIIIKSFNGIGDLLFVTPTLRKIKEAYPKSHIIVNTNYPELLLDNPYVDIIDVSKEGVFLGYPDPIHQVWPTEHHIMSDWRIVCKAYGLVTERPSLKPEIYGLPNPHKMDHVGVQVMHKGHWHKKKMWPNFNKVAELDWFYPIQKYTSIRELVSLIASMKAVVCAEGGISHIARAVGTEAIVIYGGFANPKWNGYKEQINLCNEKWCSYCYDPTPCKNEIERLCLKEIMVNDVLHHIRGLSKITALEGHNAKQFIEDDALVWCHGYGIDVGGGRWPLRGARSVDDEEVENAYKIHENLNSLDYVFSSHCIEHLEYPKFAIREWKGVLKQGGILYLYFPSPDYVPWRKESMPKWHKHNLRISDVLEMLDGFEILELMEKDYYFGQKIIGRKK